MKQRLQLPTTAEKINTNIIGSSCNVVDIINVMHIYVQYPVVAALCTSIFRSLTAVTNTTNVFWPYARNA